MLGTWVSVAGDRLKLCIDLSVLCLPVSGVSLEGWKLRLCALQEFSEMLNSSGFTTESN